MLTYDRIISEQTIERMTKAILSRNENGRGIVTASLVAIAFFTGLRASELANLQWNDVFEDYLIVRRGKGGRPRTVFFGPKTTKYLDDLRDWYAARGELTQRLFLGQRGPFRRETLSRIFKYWARELGLPDRVTLHSTRHGHGTMLLNKGLPLSAVRDQLGHRNISITSIYLHFTAENQSLLQKAL